MTTEQAGRYLTLLWGGMMVGPLHRFGHHAEG
jgi:hypothetical protein